MYLYYYVGTNISVIYWYTNIYHDITAGGGAAYGGGMPGMMGMPGMSYISTYISKTTYISVY